MAKEIVWDSLTPIEAKTLAALKRSGTEVFAAPIEIKHKGQLKSLGITWAQCRTWYIGSDPVTVHLTPADEATYKFLLGELRTKHRKKHRKNRCPVPGKLKPLIPCPECNSCAKCPYPEYRDKHEMQEVVFDDEIKVQRTRSTESPDYHKLEVKWKIQGACKMMDEQNPLFAKAIILKEYNGYTVPEIAEILHCTEYDVRYYLRRATEIGKEFKREYYRNDD